MLTKDTAAQFLNECAAIGKLWGVKFVKVELAYASTATEVADATAKCIKELKLPDQHEINEEAAGKAAKGREKIE